MKKQRINYFKVILAIITLPELYIIFTTDKNILENNINLYRLYLLILMFIIFNILYILYSKEFKKGVKKQNESFGKYK